MNKKVSNGYRPVKAPYGYLNDPIGLKGEKKIFVDDKYFKPIQKFLKSFAKGIYSVPELRKKMTEQGILSRSNKPFSNSSLYLILKRRFYCGEYYWQGKLIKGKHKPMITIEEYDKIQFLLGRDQKISQTKYQNYYSGFIKCSSCDSCITGYSKTKHNRYKGVSIYHYLKCVNKDKNCTQKPLTRKMVDKEVLSLLQSLTLSKSIIDFVLIKLREANEKEEKQDANKIQLLKIRKNEIENEITVLGEKLIKGIVKDDLYLKLNQKLEEEASLIQQKIKIQKNLTELDFDKVRSLFEFALHAQKKFKTGSFEQRKKILNIIGSNFLLKGEKLSLELSLAFSIIKEIKHLFDLENRRIELNYNRSSKGLKPVLCTDSLVWSSLRERLRTYFQENIDIDSNPKNEL
jgi:hypothetical protein